MPETIELYCLSVEDISVAGPESMVVTLAEVDVAQLILEVGLENLIDEMPEKQILEYLEEKRKNAEEEAENE